MPKIKFIADTASDIPDELLLEYDIDMPSVPITIEGKGYFERRSFSVREFYQILSGCAEIPATSRVPAEDYKACYERAFSYGFTDIINVTINAGGSGTNASAHMAKSLFFEEHPGAEGKFNIHIVDSKTYTMAYGYPVVQGAKMAREGKSCGEILDYLYDFFDRCEIYLACYSLDYAKKLQGEGRFTYLGFSSHYGDGDVIRAAIETGAFEACELPYNVYNPVLAEEGAVNLFKLAGEHGMGIINMKAYNGSGTMAIFKQIKGLTKIDYPDMTRFCLSNPYVSTIDAGARSMEEFLSDAEAANQPAMTAQERAELRERARRVSPYLNTICRECMHCLEKFECPQGVNFPKLLGIHGRYLVSSSLGFDTASYKGEYAAAATDSACIACGACLPWCEYHLDIPEMMAKASGELGA